MDLMAALQLVMKKSSAHDGLVKGLREAVRMQLRSMLRRYVSLLRIATILMSWNSSRHYAEHNVHLVIVPSAKTLGEWAGVSTHYLHLPQNLASYSSA
jgi:small subunit ribosomal protein S12e